MPFARVGFACCLFFLGSSTFAQRTGDFLTPQMTRSNPHPDSLGIAYSSGLWPKVGGVATVYYIIDSASDPNATPNINTAIKQFNADFPGMIQWVPWKSSLGPNYVDIDLSAGQTNYQCEALEGYEARAAQPMTGATNCTIGTILHEMGHIIGLWHEQSRPDRGNYIRLTYSNVIEGSRSNFLVEPDNYQRLALYDFASLMQYPPFAFSRNGGPVIESIPAGIPLGGEGVPAPTTIDYSARDKEGIRRLYGAAPTQVTVTSNPVGLQVIVDGATITTPKTYTWALNSTHTLNTPTAVQTLSGDIANSTIPATFYYTYGRWNDSTAQSHTITVTPGNGQLQFPATSPQVATYSANFIQLVPYTATIYPANSGTVAVSPSPTTYSGITGSFFTARQSVTLTPTAQPKWKFYGFNNAPYYLPGGLGANPKTFYVPDTGNPVDTTVEFSNSQVYSVSVTPSAATSNLSVNADGFAYSPKKFSPMQGYDPTWKPGTTHTIGISSPEQPYSLNSRYVFSNWSDGGAVSHTITLPSSSTSYVATVDAEFRPATNFSFPPCGGTATLSPASPTGDGFYPAGQQLQYQATPATGWTFAGWTYDLTGTTNPATLIAKDETLVYANFNITNTPLTVSSLNPSTATSGAGAFTLTINGTGFAPGSLVTFNNVYRTVSYVSPTQLTVPINASDIATPGAYEVAVENFPPGWTGCAVFGYQPFFVAKAP